MTDKQVTKHPGGRPTKYDPSIVGKAETYLTTCGREQTSLPSVEGLALYLDVSKQTLMNWSKEYPEFLDALKKIEVIQKQQLMDDGMYGGKEVNSAMAIFLLKANHGLNEGPKTLVQVNNYKDSISTVFEDELPKED